METVYIILEESIENLAYGNQYKSQTFEVFFQFENVIKRVEEWKNNYKDLVITETKDEDYEFYFESEYNEFQYRIIVWLYETQDSFKK